MKIALAGLLLLAACAPKHEDQAAPAASGPVSCADCGARSGAAHVCRVTFWCDSCGRDAGDGHRCQGATPDLDTVFCAVCRIETDRPVTVEGGTHECGRTSICETCQRKNPDALQEHARTHVCGLTRYCSTCRRDVGEHHQCAEGTFFCLRCRVERHPAAHACDRSRFCPPCRLEASRRPGEHRHGATRFCDRCGKEADLPHVHG